MNVAATSASNGNSVKKSASDTLTAAQTTKRHTAASVEEEPRYTRPSEATAKENKRQQKLLDSFFSSRVHSPEHEVSLNVASLNIRDPSHELPRSDPPYHRAQWDQG